MLNWCIFNKKAASFRKLLELGADPNWLDKNDAFPFPIIEASKRIGTYLNDALMYGGNPNCYFKKGQWFADCTPLGGAIYSSDSNNVKLLIEHGADINYTPIYYCNPLRIAMIQEEIEICKYLIIKGADCSKAITIRENKDTVGVLYYLREMTFPLNSKRHEIKMKVIELLSAKGYDYWKYPIPENVRKSFLGEDDFLAKY